MVGYILTTEQKNKVQGKFINPFQFINCVQDINDKWFFFANDSDKIEFQNTEFMWLFDLQKSEFTPKPTPLFLP
jgi:hypothetical protein